MERRILLRLITNQIIQLQENNLNITRGPIDPKKYRLFYW